MENKRLFILGFLVGVFLVAVVVVLAFSVGRGSVAYASDGGFSDVPDDVRWGRLVNEMGRLGYVVGVGGGEFRPFATMTRAQGAVLIVRAAEGVGFWPPDASGKFVDTPPGWWGSRWVEYAVSAELMAPLDEDMFGSQMPLTRADGTVLLALGLGLEDDRPRD